MMLAVRGISYHLGDHASCTNLTGMVIPDGVTEIGPGAFRNCTGLTSVAIPTGVEQLSLGVFSGYTALTNVTMAKKSKYDKTVFDNCPNLKDIVRV